jgi:hypothetical protein
LPTASIGRCGGTATSGSLAESIVGDASLWAFYRLEESAGPTAADSGPFALHMTAGNPGAITWGQAAPAFATQAPLFAPSGYEARATGFSGLASGDMTAEIWIYRLGGLDDFAIGTANPFGTFQGWGLRVFPGPPDVAVLNVADGVSRGLIVGTSAITTGTWRYIAAVRSAGTWTLYVDGVPEGTPITKVPTNEPDLWIGAVPTNTTFHSNARYSFAAVYNRAFSASELAAHYALA